MGYTRVVKTSQMDMQGFLSKKKVREKTRRGLDTRGQKPAIPETRRGTSRYPSEKKLPGKAKNTTKSLPEKKKKKREAKGQEIKRGKDCSNFQETPD